MPKTSKPSRAPRRKTGGSRGRSARAGRIALWAALGVVLLALILAAAGSIAMHRILATGKVKEWVSAHPEKLRLEYASATGWVPWNVRVRGLELRSRDPNVEWWFRIDDARFSFSPLSLLAKHFHVTRLRATGLEYRLRIRAAPPEASESHLAALPPIPGFGDRPEPPGEPAGPPEQEEKRPFKVEVDDISIEGLREVWIDIYRYAGGTGSLTGSFSLHPRRRAQVGPARVLLQKGDLTLGKNVLVRGGTFDTTAVIREFDPRLVRGDAVWPFISGKVLLEGPLGGLGFLNHFIEGEPRISGGAGSVRFALDVEKGKGNGSVSLASRGVSARYREAALRGDLSLAARIPLWAMETNHLDLSGTRIELKDFSSGGAPGPDSRDWWGRFDLKSADVRPERPAAFASSVAVHCRDARPLFTLFEVGLPGWARGVLKLEGLDATARVGLGKDVTDVEGLDAKGGAFRIRGRYRERKAEKRGAFLVEAGALAVGLDIEGAKSTLKLLGARSWFEEQPPTLATSPPRR